MPSARIRVVGGYGHLAMAHEGRDIGAWCNKVGHGFLGSSEAPGYERVFVKRAK